MSGLEVFCEVDDFMLSFAPHLQAIQLAAGKQRERAGQLCPAVGVLPSDMVDNSLDPGERCARRLPLVLAAAQA